MPNVEAIQPEQGTRAMKEYQDLVVNLHYTDICNYRCRFCHSRFGRTPLGLEEWKRIVSNITRDVDVRRFNLAGGEPLAAPFAQGLIDHIHGLGIPVSVITNGSLLTPSWIDANRNKLSMIGISVDAFRHEDNCRLGRVNGAGQSLSMSRLGELARAIHAAGIRLKINTVVNRVNCRQDFHALVAAVRPDRWKLLRMIRIEGTNDHADDLLVSGAEFEAFAARHADCRPVVENTADIVNAYIVVNPMGRLLDNTGGRYRETPSLLDHSFGKVFPSVAFDRRAYERRYKAA